MNKVLFGVSLFGLIFSSIFTVVSIWNNSDWMLLERGYYTFGMIMVAVLVYLGIQQVLNVNSQGTLNRFNSVVSIAFAIVAIIFVGVSIRNTDWELLEKGYYWMGLAFISITSAMVSATINQFFKEQ